MDLEQVFQKHVLDGTSFFFTQAPRTLNEEYELRSDIAKSCGASLHEVVIVGSAKMGFSAKTEKFTEFDGKFSQTNNPNDRSDVDVALVNRDFFDSSTERIFELSRHFEREWIQRYWTTNRYYLGEKNLFVEYAVHLARGWLRPDFLPNLFLATAPWVPVCERWTTSLGRRVNVGIYSSWNYLKHYHMDHLGYLRSKLATLEMT